MFSAHHVAQCGATGGAQPQAGLNIDCKVLQNSTFSQFEVLQNQTFFLQHFKYFIIEKKFDFEVDNFKIAKKFDFEVLQNFEKVRFLSTSKSNFADDV